MSRASLRSNADLALPSDRRVPRPNRGDGWNALADIETFVFAVEVADNARVDASGQRSKSLRTPDLGSIALLRTCKTVHAEATPIFHKSLDQTATVDDEPDGHRNGRFMGNITDWQAPRHITTLKVNLWDMTRSAWRELPQRTEGLLEAGDYGRNLKALTMGFRFAFSGTFTEELCDVLKGIKCKGKVIVRIGTQGDKAILINDNLDIWSSSRKPSECMVTRPSLSGFVTDCS